MSSCSVLRKSPDYTCRVVKDASRGSLAGFGRFQGDKTGSTELCCSIPCTNEKDYLQFQRAFRRWFRALDMIELREATPDDLDAVLAVHRDAIRSIATDRYTEGEREAWAAAQDDPDQYPVDEDTQYLAVAETADGRIVGFVGLDLKDGVVETLYVDPTMQGEGIGTKLLTHAEAMLRTHGHDLCVIAASLNSVPFYQRQGYRIGDETFSLEMTDTHLEFTRMEKSLD